MSACIVRDGDGSRLTVQAVPRAAHSEVAGFHGDTLRIRLKAPPVDGKANRVLLAFLAESLGLPRRSLTLSSGETSRRKSIRIAGLLPETVLARLGLTFTAG